MQPFLKKGYNVTMNNYFTSINLANKLKVKKNYTSWYNKKEKKEVPKVEEKMKGKPLYISEIYPSPSNVTSTICKAKKSKLIYMLSSMHQIVFVDQLHPKNYQKQSRVTTGQK